jgi:hypothetical protein
MMAKKKDPGLSKAEANVQEMQGGFVPIEEGGKTQWVDPATLSKQQQADIQNLSTNVSSQAEVPSVRAAIKNEGAAGTTGQTGEAAYQQLADAQANQYLAMTKALDPLTSGAALPAIEANASQQASQMLGASASSPVSQWLNQQTQAAQAQNAPAQAANAQVGIAQDYASTLLAGGLENMGKAESQMMQAAPYQQLLQSLAADVPYKLLGGESLATILPTVKTAEAGLGLSTAGAPTTSAPQLPSINQGVAPNPALSAFSPNPAPQT